MIGREEVEGEGAGKKSNFLGALRTGGTAGERTGTGNMRGVGLESGLG